MGDRDRNVKRTALNSLSELVVGKGDECAIEAVAALLEDQDHWGYNWVMFNAVDALIKIAEKGDRSAVAAVAAQLEHQETAVRRAAINALPKLAEKGDPRTVAAVAA